MTLPKKKQRTSNDQPWWVEDGEVTIPHDGAGATFLTKSDLYAMIGAIEAEWKPPYPDLPDGSCGCCEAKPGTQHDDDCANMRASMRRGH